MATGNGTPPSSQQNDGCSQALSGCGSSFATWFTLVLLGIGAVWNMTQIQNLKQQVEKDANAEWQEPLVYSIVAKAGTEGRTVDDLYDRYREAAQKAIDNQRVTAKVLPKNAFRQVLISLSSKRVIIAIGTDKYRILGLSDLCGCGHAVSELVDQLTSTTLDFLSTQQTNGMLTQEQIISAIRGLGTKPLNDGEAQVVFESLWEKGLIGIDRASGKVWNLGKNRQKTADCYTVFTAPFVRRPTNPVEPTFVPAPSGPPAPSPPDGTFVPQPSPSYDEPPARSKRKYPPEGTTPVLSQPSDGYPKVLPDDKFEPQPSPNYDQPRPQKRKLRIPEGVITPPTSSGSPTT